MMDLGAILSKLHGSEVVSIPPGVYEGGIVLRASHVTLRAQPGTVFVKGGPHYALKADGVQGVTIDGLALIQSDGHGFMATNCRDLHLLNVVADDNAVTGILTGDCHGVTVQGCRARRNRQQHGCYLSGRGGQYEVLHNVFTGNARCGCQVNAHPGKAQGLRLIGNDLSRNGNVGAQIAGVTGGEIADNDVSGNPRGGTVLWTDNGGKGYAPQNIDCRWQSGSFSVSRWSRGIQLPPGVKATIPEGG